MALAAAGVVGAILNTVLVMGLMYILFQDAYAAAKGIETTMVLAGILGVVGTNGVAETVVAAVLVTAIGKGILAATKRG